MRQLTAKQKKLLDKFIQDSTIPKAERWDSNCFNVKGTKTPTLGFDDISTQLYFDLIRINDTEILHQEIERYMRDQTTKITYAL